MYDHDKPSPSSSLILSSRFSAVPCSPFGPSPLSVLFHQDCLDIGSNHKSADLRLHLPQHASRIHTLLACDSWLSVGK